MTLDLEVNQSTPTLTPSTENSTEPTAQVAGIVGHVSNSKSPQAFVGESAGESPHPGTRRRRSSMENMLFRGERILLKHPDETPDSRTKRKVQEEEIKQYRLKKKQEKETSSRSPPPPGGESIASKYINNGKPSQPKLKIAEMKTTQAPKSASATCVIF